MYLFLVGAAPGTAPVVIVAAPNTEHLSPVPDPGPDRCCRPRLRASGRAQHGSPVPARDPFDAAAIAMHLEANDVVPGEVVQRSGADVEGPSMYIQDPEGNMLELNGP